MHFNALSKRVTPQNVKTIFRYNISSKQLIFSRYNGKLCSLAKLKESFHIGGEGRKLTPRPPYVTFLMVHSKYVVFCAGNYQRIIIIMYYDILHFIKSNAF